MTRSELPRITPSGLTVASGAMALGVSGWALGYTTLTVIAAGAILSVVFAALLAARLPELRIDQRIDAPRVQRGQRSTALVSVENRGSRRSNACVLSETIGSTSLERPVESLAAGGRSVVRFELPTTHRGDVEIGPLRLAQTDPFGFFRSERHVSSTVTLFVQPRIHALDPRPGGRLRHLDGPVTDGAPQGTITFHSLREYSYGDDMRRVHWRSSARTGTLMIREHVDTSLPSTVVVIDTRTSSYAGVDFEEAVDIAASIVDASQRSGYHVRLITSCGTSINVRAGHRGTAVGDFLTSLQPAETHELDSVVTEVSRTRHHDAIAVVGGRVTPSMLADVTRLCQRFANSTFVTIRPDEDGRNLRWTNGLHLDGSTAEQALHRWQVAGATTRAHGVAG